MFKPDPNELSQGGMGEVAIKVTLKGVGHPERWTDRQVLEFGNAVAALRLQPAHLE